MRETDCCTPKGPSTPLEAEDELCASGEPQKGRGYLLQGALCPSTNHRAEDTPTTGHLTMWRHVSLASSPPREEGVGKTQLLAQRGPGKIQQVGGQNLWVNVTSLEINGAGVRKYCQVWEPATWSYAECGGSRSTPLAPQVLTLRRDYFFFTV